MKVKEIILLIFIIAAGVFFYHAYTGKIYIDLDWGEGIFFNLDEFVYEESQEIDPPFLPELEIINAHGDVEIQGTEEQRVTIFFQKEIWRKNKEQADKVAEELQMTVNKDDQRLTISTNRADFRRKRFRTNFRIHVPAGMDIKVKNSYGLVKTLKVGKTDIINPHGKIVAMDIGGDLFLQNKYRDIEVENVQSDCQIDSRHSSVTVNGVKGEINIVHRYGNIHLEDISQGVTVEGSHTEVFGQRIAGSVDIETSYKKIILFDVGPTEIRGRHSRIEVDGARENLEIYDRYGKVILNNIQGNLKIDGKNLGVSGTGINGEKIFISTSYKNIKLTEFSGTTTILLSNGEVILKPYPLTHPVEVKGKYADIKFYWPSGEKYPFEARVKSGDIKWEVPAEFNYQEENSFTIIKAFVQEKEKPSVFLSTTYGTIRIEVTEHTN